MIYTLSITNNNQKMTGQRRSVKRGGKRSSKRSGKRSSKRSGKRTCRRGGTIIGRPYFGQ
jgi:hypothetical protein